MVTFVTVLYYNISLDLGMFLHQTLRNVWTFFCEAVIPIGKIAAHSAYDMFHGIST